MKNLVPITMLAQHGEINQTVIVYVKRTSLPVALTMTGVMSISVIMTIIAIVSDTWSTFKDAAFDQSLNWGIWKVCRDTYENGITIHACQTLFQSSTVDMTATELMFVQWTSKDQAIITVIRVFLFCMILAVLAIYPLIYLSYRKSIKYGLWIHCPVGIWLALYLIIISAYLNLDQDALYKLQNQTLREFLGWGFFVNVLTIVPMIANIALFWSANYMCVTVQKYDRMGNLLVQSAGGPDNSISLLQQSDEDGWEKGGVEASLSAVLDDSTAKEVKRANNDIEIAING
eukprot:CFRG6758T1